MAKKHWAIYPRTKEAMTQGIKLAKGSLRFGTQTVINTTDEKLVREIEEQHKGEAYAVKDEQLARARDSESYDIIQDSKGARIKNLHNYTFTATKPKPKGWPDKIKRFIIDHQLSNWFWFWDVEHNGKREKGVRLLGREFVW